MAQALLIALFAVFCVVFAGQYYQDPSVDLSNYATCQVFGDPHWDTFDNRQYTYMSAAGTETYLAVMKDILVWGHTFICGGDTQQDGYYITCTDYIGIRHGDTSIRLGTDGTLFTTSVDGYTITSQITADQGEQNSILNGATVSPLNGGWLVQFNDPSLDCQISTAGYYVAITMNRNVFRNQVGGTCGYFNDCLDDEYLDVNCVMQNGVTDATNGYAQGAGLDYFFDSWGRKSADNDDAVTNWAANKCPVTTVQSCQPPPATDPPAPVPVDNGATSAIAGTAASSGPAGDATSGTSGAGSNNGYGTAGAASSGNNGDNGNGNNNGGNGDIGGTADGGSTGNGNNGANGPASTSGNGNNGGSVDGGSTGNTNNPQTPAPATDAPATPAPATDAPATPAPATDAPATPAPATDAPATPAPATDAPATPAPATDAPATPAPVTPSPATPAPVTEAPVTPAPVPQTPAPVPTNAPGEDNCDINYANHQQAVAATEACLNAGMPLDVLCACKQKFVNSNQNYTNDWSLSFFCNGHIGTFANATYGDDIVRHCENEIPDPTSATYCTCIYDHNIGGTDFIPPSGTAYYISCASSASTDCYNAGACADHCSYNGKCVDGKCVCNDGYSGSTCATKGLTKAAKIAVITAGVLAAIIIGAVAFVALSGYGGMKGYMYMKDHKIGGAQNNPLYNEKPTNSNPFYAGKN